MQQSYSTTSSAHNSPRSKRSARPLPFTVAIPPPPASFNHPSVLQDPFQSYSPRPLRAAHFRESVIEVQGLYDHKGKDRERIVNELYDTGAIFENPFTLVKGRDAIADVFGLLAMVPGVGWSELGDVLESQSYDGHRLMTFSHTLHLELLPFLHSEQVQSLSDPSATPSRRRAFSIFSLPSTPFPQTPSASIRDSFFGTPSSEGIRSKTHAAGSKSGGISSLLSLLSPLLLLQTITTLHCKLHTQLLFNEEGRIIKHEDIWGIKEMIEGIFPVVGMMYQLNRQGFGWLAGAVSRKIVGRENLGKETEGKDIETGLSKDEPSSIRTPEEEEVSSFPLPITRPALSPLEIELPRSNGLQLVGDPAVTRPGIPSNCTVDRD